MINDILSFFWPNMYNKVEIILNDNHVHQAVVRIPKDLRYEHGGVRYEMYERQLRVPTADGGSVLKRNSVVYRDGRLNKFYFKEGNPSPIDMRELEIGENLNIRESIDKKDIDNLWIEPKGAMDEIWNLLKPAIFIIIGAAIVWFIMKNQGGTT